MNINNSNKTCKFLIAAISIHCLVVLCSVIMAVVINENGFKVFCEHFNMRDVVKNELNLQQVIVQYSGYELQNDGNYRVVDNDPQLTISIQEQRIKNIKVIFNEKLEKDMAVELFWVEVAGEGFTQDKSLKVNACSGEDEVTIAVNDISMAQIRLDIGNDLGDEISLKSVILNDKPDMNFWNDLKSHIHWKELFLWIQIYFIIFEFLIIHKFFSAKKIYVFIYKKRWIIAGVLLFLIVANKLNGDSVAIYSQFIQPNEGSEYIDPVIGQPRYIRSDEYIVDTPSKLASSYGEHPFEKYNYIQRGTATLNMLNGIYLGYSTIGKNPFLFAYKILPFEYAFSFNWYAPIILTFMVTFELCLILANRKRIIALTGTCLIVFSSFYLWWGFPSFLLAIHGALVCAYYFVVCRDRWKRVLFILGFSLSCSYYILSLYPAWIVPMGYVALVGGIWILHDNWEKVKQFQLFEFIIIGIAILLCISFVAVYLWESREYIIAISNTAYPGQRLENGSFSLDRIFYYFQSYMYGFKDVGNSSELSGFMCFFPIPLIAGIWQWIRSPKKDWWMTGMIFITLFFLVYCTVGLPAIIAKVTLLNRCTPKRMAPLIALIEIYLLVRYLGLKKQQAEIVKMPVGIAGIISILTAAAGWYVVSNTSKGYLSKEWCLVSCVIILVVGYYILCRYNKKVENVVCFGLCGISIIVALSVRPVSIGLDAIFSKPVTKEIQQICSQNDDTKWISYTDDFRFSGFLVACGAPTINSVNTYPNMKLWGKLDSEGVYEDIYNRYAHVTMELVQDDTNCELVYADSIKWNLSYDDLIKTGCTHIFSLEPVESQDESIQFVLLYEEDGCYIYEVQYM